MRRIVLQIGALSRAHLRGKRKGNFLQPKAIEVCDEIIGTSDVEEAANITSVSRAGNASFIGKDVIPAFLVSSCSTEADETPLPGAAHEKIFQTKEGLTNGCGDDWNGYRQGVGSAVGEELKKKLYRPEVLTYFGKLEALTVALEACSGSHYWGRELAKLGHTVRLMPPQYVKPYVKRNKNDAADAEACWEAGAAALDAFCAGKDPGAAGGIAAAP